jgi:hypothetical protein
MSEEKYPPINVLNIVRGFANPALRHHITPYRFETRKGETYRIAQIRQVHRERVGKGFHYHYVVKTDTGRYFHLVFDTSAISWKMVQEVDEMLFFNE